MATEVKEQKKEEVKVDSLKNYIKNLAKDEKSLKSISFSLRMFCWKN